MKLIITLLTLFCSLQVLALDLKVGDAAPLFKASTHEKKEFALESRKNTWTVLYFYPKAGTPGCTKQACAFRDSIKKIRDQKAEVFGISTDDVQALEKFYKEHSLNFILLSDFDGKIAEAYGTKIPLVTYSKRITFIIDPELKISSIDRDVDPVLDAEKVANKLKEFQAKKK